MGRYTEVTREIGRLEANLAAVQAALRTTKEEGDRARADAADAQARAIGAFLRFLLRDCPFQVWRRRWPLHTMRRKNCAAALMTWEIAMILSAGLHWRP